MRKADKREDVSQCENNLQTFVDVSIIVRYPNESVSCSVIVFSIDPIVP